MRERRESLTYPNLRTSPTLFFSCKVPNLEFPLVFYRTICFALLNPRQHASKVYNYLPLCYTLGGIPNIFTNFRTLLGDISFTRLFCFCSKKFLHEVIIFYYLKVFPYSFFIRGVCFQFILRKFTVYSRRGPTQNFRPSSV